MRIIRGRNKGKILNAPKHLPIRPTTDMAKEGIFNILENYFEWDSTRALDLFCGSGNISFELASRRCHNIISVDSYPNCIRYVNKISKDLKYDEIQTVLGDAMVYLSRQKKKWNFIFADPPYDFNNYEELIFKSIERLENDGIFILEHGGKIDFQNYDNLVSVRKYGSVRISVFQKSSISSNS
mgnify:CR=1 FL=1